MECPCTARTIIAPWMLASSKRFLSSPSMTPFTSSRVARSIRNLGSLITSLTLQKPSGRTSTPRSPATCRKIQASAVELAPRDRQGLGLPLKKPRPRDIHWVAPRLCPNALRVSHACLALLIASRTPSLAKFLSTSTVFRNPWWTFELPLGEI